MNVSFFIAKRYLKSKKSHNIVNLISRISVIGIIVGTMALIIVLSVFNGFEDVVISLFNSFDSDIKITKVEGKTFHSSEIAENSIKEIDGVVHYEEVLEEIALLTYGQKQQIAILKGVGDDYAEMTGVDSMLLDGEFVLTYKESNFVVLGIGIKYALGVNLNDFSTPIIAYAPNRLKKTYSGLGMSDAFVSDVLFPSGIFSIQQDFDSKYVFVPINFLRNLYKYDDEVTAIEIGVSPNVDLDEVQEKIKEILGPDYNVKNRLEQQEFIYKIMKTEKWAVFLILSFILLIATFNVVGVLSMLIIEKKKDINTLLYLGADEKLIRRIFLIEGIMIIMLGGIIGLSLGIFICWLQQHFGFIRMQNSGSFVVSVYPIKMIWTDFLNVFITISLIGYLAALYPVFQITRKHFNKEKPRYN